MADTYVRVYVRVRVCLFATVLRAEEQTYTACRLRPACGTESHLI